MRFLIYLLTMFSVVYGQEYYQKNGVEGYILKAGVFNNEEYLNPDVRDIECFEIKLKEVNPGYYADFYRQYYSKISKGKEYLMVKFINKSYLGKDVKELKKPFIVMDGCENIRFIVYDIKKQQIISDVNGGGCDS